MCYGMGCKYEDQNGECCKPSNVYGDCPAIEPSYTCDNCGCEVHECELNELDGQLLCSDCYDTITAEIAEAEN